MARRRDNTDGQIDLTPMIDVVFQLIIFFIVAVTMQKEFNRDIILEHAPQSPVIEGDNPMLLTIEVNAKGWISIQNAQLSRAKLRQIMVRRFNTFGEFPVMIRGDKRTRHADIRAVMDICTDIGIWRLTFVAIHEKKT